MAPGLAFDEGPLQDMSPTDLQVLKIWFNFVDSDRDGRVTAQEAAAFFLRSELSADMLQGVWAAADGNRQGFLGLGDFAIAMKLIGQLQIREGDELARANSKSRATADGEESTLPFMRGLQEALEGREPLPQNKMEKSTSGSSWGFFKPKAVPEVSVTSVVDGLKELYSSKLRPLEANHKFHELVSPELRPSDFDAKPMVLLLGQYSTGKTTFIKSVLGKGYPGSHIGPEPTTDRFVVVMNGADERTIPGHTAGVQKDLPFSGLTRFGGAFLEKFEVAQLPHPLLRYFTFVDSPGVLSGEKQRTMRSYDFTGVTEWFATRSDLILLLFDPHKLDISDEFKRVICSLKGNYDKVRVVLNKADQMETQQLMRVYGALMWSLGKVLNTPEVVRVYIGSFSENQLPPRASTSSSPADSSSSSTLEDCGSSDSSSSFSTPPPSSSTGTRLTGAAAGAQGQGQAQGQLVSLELCRKEQDDLLADLCDLPRRSADRKVNEFVKRARAAKVHALVTSHLRMQMPMFGRPSAQKKLLETLELEIQKVQREHHLPPGDMPDAEELRGPLSAYAFDTLEKIKPKLIEDVDSILAKDVPDLLSKFRNPYSAPGGRL